MVKLKIKASSPAILENQKKSPNHLFVDDTLTDDKSVHPNSSMEETGLVEGSKKRKIKDETVCTSTVLDPDDDTSEKPRIKIKIKIRMDNIVHTNPAKEEKRSKIRTKGKKNKKDMLVLNDLPGGKERLKIRALNRMGDDTPSPFNYVTNMIYPEQFQFPVNPIRCDCVGGCSSVGGCSCSSVLHNGGKVSYDYKGRLVMPREKSVIRECGPWCKCPRTCKNRVSQHGVKHRLEVFKTESMEWGLRSPTYISSGSFICEYVGELRDETDEKSDHVWEISNGGVCIDATRYGNIGRFISHSSTPNLYAQEVLYDHGDMRMPHVMFFASKNIPPMKQLTCDYESA